MFGNAMGMMGSNMKQNMGMGSGGPLMGNMGGANPMPSPTAMGGGFHNGTEMAKGAGLDPMGGHKWNNNEITGMVNDPSGGMVNKTALGGMLGSAFGRF